MKSLNTINRDFLYPLFLCGILTFLISLNYFCFGNILYDCGREFLVPKAVLEGKILIKEIFISYFPLSYQINAVLFKIFGANLDVLRLTGSLVSIIDTVFYYFICRLFTDEKKSFQISIIASFVTMFNVSYIFNYVMPYAYAYAYATVFFISGGYFALKYIKSNEIKFLFASIFLQGVCFAFKAEFIFLIVPYFILFFYKKLNLKNALISVCLFFVPVFASFLILFISGFNFSDLTEYISFLKNFISSDVLKEYSTNIFYKSPAAYLSRNILSLLLFLIPFLVFYAVLFLPARFKKNFLYNFLTGVLFVLFCIYTVIKGKFIAVEMFSYLCILNLIFLVFLLKERQKNAAAVIYLIIFQFALCIRQNFIYTENYSCYTMGIAIIAMLLSFEIFIKNQIFNKIFMTFLMTLSIANVGYFSIYDTLFTPYVYNSGKGIFRREPTKLQKTIEDTIDFMKTIDENKTILILPEGAMLNFIAERKTNYKFHQLLPNHIEAMGEDNIINELEKNKPDYIFLSNLSYVLYGKTHICKDFGLKICKFVFENYINIKTIANDKNLIFEVYKVK